MTTLFATAAALVGAVCFIGFSVHLLESEKRCLLYLVVGLGLSAFAWLQNPMAYLMSMTILLCVGVVAVTLLIDFVFREPPESRKE